MVRPTGTKDVPSCNNRFAILDENYAESQNRRTLPAETQLPGKPPPPPPLPRQGNRTTLPWKQLTAQQLINNQNGLNLE
jgi:hypothetical protein